MAEPAMLIETSFADGIEIISASAELPDQTRRHWTTSLRQIAKALGKPLEVIPARYSAVRADLAQLHEAPAGLTAKTLRNHKSNAKSALLWLAQEKGIPQQTVDSRMGGAAGQDPRWRGPLAAFVFHALLLGERSRPSCRR